MPPRDRIIMIKRATPKRVTLPNGRTFLARYRRATREMIFLPILVYREYIKKELLQKVKEGEGE